MVITWWVTANGKMFKGTLNGESVEFQVILKKGKDGKFNGYTMVKRKLQEGTIFTLKKKTLTIFNTL